MPSHAQRGRWGGGRSCGRPADLPSRHVVSRQEVLVAGERSAGDCNDGRQLFLLQITHDRAPSHPKQLCCLGQRQSQSRSPLSEIGSRHRLLLFSDPPQRRGRNVQSPPFGFDWPSEPKTVFHNRDLGEGLSIVHQRCEMSTASNETGHIEFIVPSVARKTDTQNTSASRAYLCDSRYLIVHADHLWSSSQISESSARRVGKAKRAHRAQCGHAEPVIGPAEARTRWLCPPYNAGSLQFTSPSWCAVRFREAGRAVRSGATVSSPSPLHPARGRGRAGSPRDIPWIGAPPCTWRRTTCPTRRPPDSQAGTDQTATARTSQSRPGARRSSAAPAGARPRSASPRRPG